MQAHLSAKPKPAAVPMPPALGSLLKRPADLKRGEGELLGELDRYLDKTISTTEKQQRCVPERDMLALMETITLSVIGRPKDDTIGRKEVKPSFVQTLDLIKSEESNWRHKWKDSAQLYEEKKPRMQQLQVQVHGQTALLKLGKMPDVIGKGGTLGTIVEWLEVMRTWVSEEMESTRGSSDIIVDRLTFAAMVSTPEPAPISCSHMNIPRLPLTGHPTLGEAARRIHRTRYADGGDNQEGQEGARKGDEQGGGCGTASPNRR